ncbi:MAG: prolyl oligopeptidase family serine peptidase [Chloroflexi bacterium]|nr:prolyl oligopeptidase family serine peptidase [Chloroflexota bacterium]
MEEKEVRPYGTWSSPITPRMIADVRRLEDVQWDPQGDGVVWMEGHGGQQVAKFTRLFHAPHAITPEQPMRGGVGYGGGSFAFSRDVLYYVQKGRLYRQKVQGEPARAITPAFGALASPTPSPDGRWVVYVHTYEGTDVLAIGDGEGQLWPQRLVTGADFYMQPTWHPEGKALAWVEWDHPNMPWDGSRLYVGFLSSDEPPRVAERRHIAGGEDVPIFQPAFSPDGRFLSYIITDGEWDRIELYDLTTGERRSLLEGEGYVLSAPAWVQGLRTYVWTPDSRFILVRNNHRGFAQLLRVDVTNGDVQPVPIEPYTWFDQPTMSREGHLTFIGSASRIPTRVVTKEGTRFRVLSRSMPEIVPPGDLSEPVPIQWKAPNGTTVHGLFYPPTNHRYTGKGLPPAIINIHGGPTSQRVANYNGDAQFFTSRGWAYLEVNYRGSTGYGRSYMNALKGHWGEYDVEDAVGAAHTLIDQGLAHPDKLVIKGGSAGGYTVLNALIRHPGLFKAGVCLYGVTNLFTLAMDTHKFEAHYLDSLVGPLPEAAHRYREWSPLFHADRIRDPVAIFQGKEDRVVPPDQAEQLVEVLRRNRVPYLYRLYEGEGHGWRKVETVESYYTDLLKFLREHVLFG